MPLPQNNYAVINYQTLDEVPLKLGKKIIKKLQNFLKKLKVASFNKKLLKVVILKSEKIMLPLEIMHQPIINPRGVSLTPEGAKQKMTTIFKNVRKISKEVTVCVFIFAVPSHMAHKLIKNVIMSCKIPLSNLTKFISKLIK